MAFWGVEVKPGKPYTHIHDSNRGPLRFSQVTLGNGEATKRSVLQCNVGNKPPVLLCSLLPDRAESSCLNLQFEESEKVVFSVVGPRSVHLAGYFIGISPRRGGGNANDSDSYGEDIWNTGSDESGSHDSEDKYESDFIDDGDSEMPPSPRRSSGVVIEEIIEDEKPVNGNPTRRRLRKKHQVSDSDEGDSDEGDVGSQHQIFVRHGKSPVSESEEEDGFPISFSVSNKNKEKNVDGDGKLDSKILDVDKKRKLDAVVQDKGSQREDEVVAVTNGKSKKKKTERIKSAPSLEADTGIPGEKIRDKQSEGYNKYADDKSDEARPCEGENENVNQDHAQKVFVTESGGKRKKKKKEKVRSGETPETRVELTVDKHEERASTVKIDTMNISEEANVGNNDKDPLVKRGHQDVPEEKQVLCSPGKVETKKKKTKDKSSFDEESRFETLRKEDGNDKSHSIHAIKNKVSKSHKKMDKDQAVAGMPPEMTTNFNEGPVPADVCHEPSKRKQKKKKR